MATGSSAGVLGFWFFLVEVACSGLAISVRASVAFVAVVPWSSVFLPGVGVLLGDIAGAGVFLGAIVIEQSDEPYCHALNTGMSSLSFNL